MMASQIVSHMRIGILGRRCLPAVLNGAQTHPWYSTSPQPQPKLSIFKTSENNPINHTFSHIGQFYTVPPEVIKNVFPFKTIPKLFLQQATAFREMCIMVRKPVIEVIKFIENADYRKPPIKYLLYGRHGTGKSVSIVHLVHFGYEKKWLLIHVPWCRPWVILPAEYAKSQSRPGRIDLPINSAAWLQQFKAQNSRLLKELDLKVSQKYMWSSREVTEEGQPLIDVIDHGINRVKHASDCLAVLLKEIKKQTESDRYKVLVACHAINAFYQTTTMEDEARKMVKLEDVTPVRAFRKLMNTDWRNAAIVLTADPRLPDLKGLSTPRALLGKEGFEALDPFIPILVDNYSDKEIESCLDYYVDRHWIQTDEGKSEAGREEVKFLSGYNPRQLMEICGPV